ncbi:MAG: CHAP domain-containing protein [Acetobacteraceae bacterium]
MPKRRALLAGLAAGTAALALPDRKSLAQSCSKVVAWEQDGPGGDIEPVAFDPYRVAALFPPLKPNINLPDPLPDFATALVDTAHAFDGLDRWTEKGQAAITAMLGLFWMGFTVCCPDHCRPSRAGCPKGCQYNSFCAAGVAYSAALAFAKANRAGTDVRTLRKYLRVVKLYNFYPSPSVPDMQEVAYGTRIWPSGRRLWQSTGATPKAGWLVVYHLHAPADHVGIVLDAKAGALDTFEFNVGNPEHKGGGTIHHCTRPIDHTVMGYIDTTTRPVLPIH